MFYFCFKITNNPSYEKIFIYIYCSHFHGHDYSRL